MVLSWSLMVVGILFRLLSTEWSFVWAGPVLGFSEDGDMSVC